MSELKHLYDNDQADRHEKLFEKDPELFSKRDRERLERVLQLVKEDEVISSSDYLHAAMILQHGGKTEYYEMAYEFAKKAADMGYQPVKGEVEPLWLAAAAKDRSLMSQRKPQLYGTQYTKDSKDGPWYLYEVDPAITDEERARWHVRSLSEAKKRVAELNRRSN